MASLHKSRAREPLAEGVMSRSYGFNSNDYHSTERGFVLSIMSGDETKAGRSTWYKLAMSQAEALGCVSWIAGELSKVNEYGPDNRSTVERLRALADNLESGT